MKKFLTVFFVHGLLHSANVSSASELETAIINANSNTDRSIVFTSSFEYDQTFRPLNVGDDFTAQGLDISIDGGNFTLTLESGKVNRGFFAGGNLSGGSPGGTISISNLTIDGAVAHGGRGGDYGGGGGAGLGGALLVTNGATVVLANVTFQNCSAVGGVGITNFDGSTSLPNGAGGGLGGEGGFGGAISPSIPIYYGGGGGGFSGSGGYGGSNGSGDVGSGGGGGAGSDGENYNGTGGNDFGGHNGGHASGGGNGSSGGGGGGIASAEQTPGTGGYGGGGGGGAVGDLISSRNGANGSDWGGGGGGPSATGGAGGFGGGGGAGYTGGGGGFGGGGGGTESGTSAGGFGGGEGNYYGGGGGAALGGALFIANGGSCTFHDGVSFSNNSVVAANSSDGTRASSALGQDIFLMSGGSLIIHITDTMTLSRSIVSDSGAGGGSGGGLTKTGPGTLTLSASNTYTGTTAIRGGTVIIENNTSFGTTAVELGATLQFGSSALSVANTVTLTDDSIVNNEGYSGTLSGTIIGTNSLTFSGTGTTTLSNTSTSGNFSGGMIVTGGLLSIAGTTNIGNGSLTLNGGGLELSSTSFEKNISIGASGGNFTVGSSGLTYSGVLSGTAGSLSKLGTGNLTLSNNNTYSGALTVSAGTLTLDPSSGQAILASSVANNGTIVLSKSQTLNTLSGSGQITLGSNTLTENSTSTSIFSGIISGAGSFIKTGGSSLTLNGANTFSGGTTIHQGTLIFGNAQGLGSGLVTVQDGVTWGPGAPCTLSNNVLLSGSSTLALSSYDMQATGSISGSAPLRKTGSGILTIPNGNSDLSGTVTLSSNTGAVVIGNNTSLGSGLVILNDMCRIKASADLTDVETPFEVTASSTGYFDTQNYTVSLAGEIGGSGDIVKSGNGTLSLTADNSSRSGDVTVAEGTLSLNSADATGDGSVVLNLSNGTTLHALNYFDYDKSIPVSGSVTMSQGSTGLRISGVLSQGSGSAGIITTDGSGGTLTLSNGSNSFTGGIVVAPRDTLVLESSGAIGNAPFTLRNGAILQAGTALSIDNQGTLTGFPFVDTNGNATTLSGSIVGSGSLTKIGLGTLTLSGINSFTGGLIIEQGSVAVNSSSSLSTSSSLVANGELLLGTDLEIGSISGNGTVSIGANTLTISGATNTSLGATLLGSGALLKTGSSSISYSGVGSAFTGTTTVSLGALSVQGSLGGTTQINPLGSIRGTGTIETLSNDGRLAPGNSIGTITVGTYTQGPYGILEIELGSRGAADLVHVTGVATVDGALDFFLQPGSHLKGDIHTFMIADGGISGTWSSNNANTLPFNYELFIGPDIAYLKVVSNRLFLDKQVAGFNPNAVIDYLEEILDEDSLLLREYVTDLNTLDDEELTEALNRLHPAFYGVNGLVQESHTTFIDTNLTSHPSQECVVLKEDPLSRHAIWVKGFTQLLKVESTQQMPKNNSLANGGMVGYDYTLQKEGTLGIAAGYNFTNVHWEPNFAKGNVSSYFFGMYGNYYLNDWTFTGSVRGGYDSIAQARDIVFTSYYFYANNHHHAWEFDTRLAAECVMTHGPYRLKPLLSLNLFCMWENQFTESGGSVFDLTVQPKSSIYLRSQAGIEFTREIRLPEATVCPLVSLGAVNVAQLSSEKYQSNFIGYEQSFTTHTYKKIWSMISPGVGLSFAHKNGFQASGTYAMQLNGNYLLQVLDVRMNYRF